jgi:hypothetical protein
MTRSTGESIRFYVRDDFHVDWQTGRKTGKANEKAHKTAAQRQAPANRRIIPVLNRRSGTL